MSRTPSRRGEEGASSVEYGLIAVAIAALVVVILFLLGGVVQETFSDSCDEIRGTASTTATCAS
jgi:pilus assembly protein Flp/PilA